MELAISCLEVAIVGGCRYPATVLRNGLASFSSRGSGALQIYCSRQFEFDPIAFTSSSTSHQFFLQFEFDCKLSAWLSAATLELDLRCLPIAKVLPDSRQRFGRPTLTPLPVAVLVAPWCGNCRTVLFFVTAERCSPAVDLTAGCEEYKGSLWPPGRCYPPPTNSRAQRNANRMLTPPTRLHADSGFASHRYRFSGDDRSRERRAPNLENRFAGRSGVVH